MDVKDRHWQTLRKLLTEGELDDVDGLQEVARAAVQGGVVRFAVEKEQRLEPWVSKELERVVFQDLLLERATQELGQVLHELRDSILLLKGSASAHMLYEHPGLRERRDVDLLIPGDNFPIAIERLIAAGWSRLPKEERPWWAERASGRYEETLFKDFGGHRVEADLHHRLSLYRHLARSDGGLLERSSRTPTLDFRLPSPEDLTLHTALHAAATGFSVPLKSWFDLHLLSCQGGLDWDALGSRAIEWNVHTALWASLTIISNRWQTHVPKRLLDALAPPTPSKQTLARMLDGEGEMPIGSGRLAKAQQQLAKSLALGGNSPWQLVLEQARLRLERPE